MNASSYEPDIYGIQQIDSVDEHYFYSHQKPTKLVYETRLIVLWGKLETSSWFLLYIGSAQLIRTYVFLKIGFWWKNPLPSTLRCLRKLLYQYSRAIWSILELLNAMFCSFVQALSSKFEVIEEKCSRWPLRFDYVLQTYQMWRLMWSSGFHFCLLSSPVNDLPCSVRF